MCYIEDHGAQMDLNLNVHMPEAPVGRRPPDPDQDQQQDANAEDDASLGDVDEAFHAVMGNVYHDPQVAFNDPTRFNSHVSSRFSIGVFTMNFLYRLVGPVEEAFEFLTGNHPQLQEIYRDDEIEYDEFGIPSHPFTQFHFLDRVIAVARFVRSKLLTYGTTITRLYKQERGERVIRHQLALALHRGWIPLTHDTVVPWHNQLPHVNQIRVGYQNGMWRTSANDELDFEPRIDEAWLFFCTSHGLVNAEVIRQQVDWNMIVQCYLSFSETTFQDSYITEEVRLFFTRRLYHSIHTFYPRFCERIRECVPEFLRFYRVALELNRLIPDTFPDVLRLDAGRLLTVFVDHWDIHDFAREMLALDLQLVQSPAHSQEVYTLQGLHDMFM